MKDMDDINEIDLRDIAKGFIRFSIKAEDTEQNQNVHNDFKEFCRLETDNNYTLGLRKLLESYSGDTKFEILYQEIQSLKNDIEVLKSKPKEDKEDELEMF
jgi:hypothetical protein